ncbi:DUF6507 family protein [Streptomyces uncialis]|uniref:DUF6507 family protein n=1 Tax=Streptomyces uncialis TaxID=1048205 RepID=UPI00225BA2C3|nr:DUF6507 family protein [Streptomyces uncialis]MCX4661455.1 DUF6507 family protein [Streptomyces uncialis]
MTGWDISPTGVKGVLEKTGTAAEGLGKAGTTLQTAVPAAAKAAGTLSMGGGGGESEGQGLVAVALSQFMTAHTERLQKIGARASASLNGAANATNAYLTGDLEQAANAQREAVKEPKIDLPGQGPPPGHPAAYQAGTG